jgi:hypothetical protein
MPEMNETAANKANVERMIADEFCVAAGPLLQKSCRVIRPSESPAPDFLLEVDGTHVGLELTAYYEQGPHNDAYERDQKIKYCIADMWQRNPDLGRFFIHLGFRLTEKGFTIPSGADAIDKFVHELVRFVREHEGATQEWRKQFDFVPAALQPRRTPQNHVLISSDKYPALSQSCDLIRLTHNPNISVSLPSTSLATRAFSPDLDEVRRVLEKKLNKLPSYRQSMPDIPIWLLVYTEGWRNSSYVFNHEEIAGRIVNQICEVISGSPSKFDRVWWGSNFGPQPDTIICVAGNETGKQL